MLSGPRENISPPADGAFNLTDPVTHQDRHWAIGMRSRPSASLEEGPELTRNGSGLGSSPVKGADLSSLHDELHSIFTFDVGTIRLKGATPKVETPSLIVNRGATNSAAKW